MSQTACWGTNKLEDCCWISFGYGSSFDLSQFWCSLEVVKILGKFHSIKHIKQGNCKYNDRNHDFGYELYDNIDLWSTLPADLKMHYSCISIEFPNKDAIKAAEWFQHFLDNCDTTGIDEKSDSYYEALKNPLYKEIHDNLRAAAERADECTHHPGTMGYYFSEGYNSHKDTAPESLEDLNTLFKDKNGEDDQWVKDLKLSRKSVELPYEEWEVILRDIQDRENKTSQEHLNKPNYLSTWDYKKEVSVIYFDNHETRDEVVGHSLGYHLTPKDSLIFGCHSMPEHYCHNISWYISPPQKWFIFGGCSKRDIYFSKSNIPYEHIYGEAQLPSPGDVIFGKSYKPEEDNINYYYRPQRDRYINYEDMPKEKL